MMDKLLQLDKDLFIYLNGSHSPRFDIIMFYISETFVWTPLYVFLLYLIYNRYRNDTWLVLIGVTITVLLSDQITSGLMKPLFMRLRPSHEPELQSIVHIVNGYRSGSLYGFASSHAADTFGTAMFLWLLLRQKYRWTILLFPWAMLVSYTRVYLGVHYPGDILAGAIVGMLCGWVCYKAVEVVKNKIDKIRSSTNAGIT